MSDPVDRRDRLRGLGRGVTSAARDLTDGQRWTTGLVLLGLVAFLGFGMRQAPVAIGAAPAPAPAPLPTDAPMPGSTTPPPPLSRLQPYPLPPSPDAADPGPEVGSEGPSIVAVVGPGNGPASDRALAGVFLDGADPRVVAADVAAGQLCRASVVDEIVIASEGLSGDLRACLLDRGYTLLTHDDHGSGPRSLSTALGVAVAVEQAGRVAPKGARLGIVASPATAAGAGAAEVALERAGYEVVTSVVGPGDDAAVLLGNVGFGLERVDTVVFALPVADQSRWLGFEVGTGQLRRHIVADVAGAIVDEAYGNPPIGALAVAATRVPWFARTHGETPAQRSCLDRFRTAHPSDPHLEPAALARLFGWCESALLVARLQPGQAVEAALSAPLDDAPRSGHLGPDASGRLAPRQVAVLRWDDGCRCWAEHRPYAPVAGR